MKLREPYGLFAALRQSAFAKAGYTVQNPCGAARNATALAISHVSRYYLEMLRFDWDERKNKSNRIKHGIWFEEAQSVFSDPHGRLFYDPEHSEHEDRFILLGVSSAARTLIVVHCYKENDSVVRIISARKATRKEVRFYEEGI